MLNKNHKHHSRPDAIPIVVSGYDRAISLGRILRSLSLAHYDVAEVPLFISLDNGGPDGTRELAESFDWPHGPKTVLARDSHLGMRDHAFECMELFGNSDYLIFLEDDSYVGPGFYNFALLISAHMSKLKECFAASFYAFDFCEFDYLRFSPLQTGEDVFLAKSATTWGILLSRTHWLEFRKWYARNCNLDTGAKFIPEQVNSWPKTSWKKFINRYLSEAQNYFLYPYTSQLTHFADSGTHFSVPSGNYQVPFSNSLSWEPRPLSCRVENLIRYDEFWEVIPPDILIKEIGYDFEFDVRRIKQLHQYRKPYVITSRTVSSALQSYAVDFFPLEMNVFHRRRGNSLHLVETKNVIPTKSSTSAAEIRLYMKDLGAERELSLAIDKILRKLKLRS